jgi:hypothetical protein
MKKSLDSGKNLVIMNAPGSRLFATLDSVNIHCVNSVDTLLSTLITFHGEEKLVIKVESVNDALFNILKALFRDGEFSYNRPGINLIYTLRCRIIVITNNAEVFDSIKLGVEHHDGLVLDLYSDSVSGYLS